MDNRKNWGIKFAEHMGGYFCKGITEPREGYDRGKIEGRPIDFWVKIHITPLKEFFENPDYTAQMTGKLNAGPLGKNLALQNGEFNIYPGEEGSGLKHISYRFGFTSADQEPFFFSGIKNIHLNRRERAPRENVTLFSTIHRGDSEEGEIMGSGILLFSILKDGPGLFSSLRVTGAQSFREKLKAMRMFTSYSSA